jgi:phosphoglycerate dehydrogenase-like enzyme
MNRRLKVGLLWPASDREVEVIRGKLDPGYDLAIPSSGEPREISKTVEDCDVLLSWSAPSPSVLHSAKKARLIQTMLAGVDSFEMTEIENRGITLAGTSGANAADVAEHVFALILAFAKDLIRSHRELRKGMFPPYDTESMNRALYGKTLAIVGLGSIGREVARRAISFGMDIKGIRRQPDGVTVDGYDIEVSGPDAMKRVLSSADYVVLSVPLTKETKGLINTEELTSMKDTAVLANVSRGEVVVEEALHEALSKEWSAGAGIDVWYEYPPSPDTPSKSGLHKLSNTVVTPHRAAWTREAYKKSLDAAIENLNRYVRGEELRNVIDLDLGY